ncbi:MAG TPA: M23 family metallopeptidase [Blastocatellia bacterium]
MAQVIRPRTFLLIGLLALGAAGLAWSQSRRPIIHSVDVQVPSAPIPVSIAGKRHLAYEIHVTNFRPSEITLIRVEISDAVRGSRLGEFRDAELGRLLGRLGASSDTADRRVIGPGMRAVAYMWLALDDAVATPARLRHKIEFDIVRASRRERVTVDAGESEVRRDQPPVLSPPLRGGPWVALYDPTMDGGHRRTIYAVNGKARIPARFAIDWVRLENDGSCARGDKSQIANWHGYGAEVLAVADGVVAEANDDIAESTSLSGGSRTPIPLENVSGNFICLDLGGGRYAFYEHLKRGSVRVKAGDRVRSGQVIGLLGNSGGSSSGPHLHFHVGDAQSELAGEGVPYVFRSFEVVGAFESIGAFASGERWKPAPSGADVLRKGELPAANTVVNFR